MRSFATIPLLLALGCGSGAKEISGPILPVTGTHRLGPMAERAWPGIAGGECFVPTVGYTGAFRMIQFTCLEAAGDVEQRLSVYLLELPEAYPRFKIQALLERIMREGMGMQAFQARNIGEIDFQVGAQPETFEAYEIDLTDRHGMERSATEYLLTRDFDEHRAALVVFSADFHLESDELWANLERFLEAVPNA